MLKKIIHKPPFIPLVFFALLFSTDKCPAPIIYTPGEGWSYETPGQAGKWQRSTAKEQLEVAQMAYEKEDFRIAIKAAGRLLRQWPFSDYAADAQYVSALAQEGNGRDEKAFRAYQNLLTKYPKYEKYDEVLKRQFAIANKFLGGQRFRLWGLFPLFRSMDKTIKMYQDMIQSGPYSEFAPQAQLHIGKARENKKDYAAAVKAYEVAADKYHDQKGVAADALFRAGEALLKEAKEAEYDQSVARRAIEVFHDFSILHPNDKRVEQADDYIRALYVEQARGYLQIARYYDKKDLPQGALTYYNEVVDIFSRLLNDVNHEYAKKARERIVQLKGKSSE